MAKESEVGESRLNVDLFFSKSIQTITSENRAHKRENARPVPRLNGLIGKETTQAACLSENVLFWMIRTSLVTKNALASRKRKCLVLQETDFKQMKTRKIF